MRKKKWRSLLSLLLAGVLAAAGPLSADALYAGRVFVFTYDSGQLPASLHDYPVNTRKNAELCLPWLWKMNYDAGEYLNNSIEAIWTAMYNASVLTIGTHGLPGEVIIPDGHSDTPHYDLMTGKLNPNTDYPSKPLLYHGKLDQTRLIIFGACYSAVTDSKSGNLLDAAVDIGADAALGWNPSISSQLTSEWQQYFFEACYFLHLDVERARLSANNRLQNERGKTDDVRAVQDCKVVGIQSTHIY